MFCRRLKISTVNWRYGETGRRQQARLLRTKKARKTAWHEKPDFLALRKKWYAKLKKKGFKDAELIDWKTGDSYECMEGISKADLKRCYTPDKQRYYELARQWLWDLRERKDVSKRDLTIWGHHSDGRSYRWIEQKTGIKRGTTERVVAMLREQMLDAYVRGGSE